MAETDKKNTIENNAQAYDSYVIQKANPIRNIHKNGVLSLQELKLLDLYLAKINSEDESTKRVTFTKMELEEIFELKQLRTEEIEKRLKNLRHYLLPYPTRFEQGFADVHLFDLCDRATVDDGSNIVEIEIEASEYARQFIFHIQDSGYLKYKFGNVRLLKSIHSYNLFMYIENNRFRGSWDIPLEDFRKEMVLGDNHQDYRKLHQNVMSVAIKELEEKTDCKFDCSKITRGKTVVGFHFEAKRRPEETEEAVERETKSETLAKLRAKVDYEVLTAVHGESARSLIDLCLRVIVDVQRKKSRTISINNEDVEVTEVKKLFDQITMKEVVAACSRFEKAEESRDIPNKEGYMLTILYNMMN